MFDIGDVGVIGGGGGFPTKQTRTIFILLFSKKTQSKLEKRNTKPGLKSGHF